MDIIFWSFCIGKWYLSVGGGRNGNCAAKREWWVGEKKGGAAAKTSRGLELKVDGSDKEKDMSRHNRFFS